MREVAHRPPPTTRSSLLITLLLAFVVAASLLPVIAARVGSRAFYVAGAVPLAALVWAALAWSRVEDGGSLAQSWEWIPQLGLTLSLRFDGFTAIMTGLVAGIGVLVFVYARGYFSPGNGPEQHSGEARSGEAHRGALHSGGAHSGDQVDLRRFASTLLAFSGSMLGLVLADDLLSIFLFWELTSITSYLLIGTEDRRTAARSGALQALLTTGAGGLAMLGGFVLIGQAAGTYSLSAIIAAPPRGAIVDWGLVLVLLGAFTKSAQVPFHTWLPRAMNAPTPVSAYLHSATMVKAGVYLVARLSPAFAPAVPWRPLVLSIGVASMLLGGYRALRQHDLKLLLAHGTVSQLGFMMVLFGAGTAETTFAGCVLLVAHGVFKAALFMTVGAIDHQAHTRDLRALGGLGRSWPVVAGAAGVAAASMAGIPPLFGFVAKEEALSSLGDLSTWWGPLVVGGVVLGSVLTVAYSARFAWGAFGPTEASPFSEGEPVGSGVPRPSIQLVSPVVLLSTATVVLGVFPWVVDPLVRAATLSLWDVPTAPHVALWHGFTPALGLSAVVLAAGGTLVARRKAVGELQARVSGGPSAQNGYDRALRGLLRSADVVTGFLQSGSLPVYLGVILLTAVVVPAVPLLADLHLPELWLVDSPAQAVIGAVMLACGVGAALARRRFVAVILLGSVGYGMAAWFVVQGAPDLAITQLLVETLSVVIFVLVFRQLPDRFPRARIPGSQAPRVAVAVASAVFVFLFTLAAVGSRTAAPVSGEYLTRARPEAGGSNVVNTIIVDFRSFDTMGEITVLAVAVLGVAALVRAARPRRGSSDV